MSEYISYQEIYKNEKTVQKKVSDVKNANSKKKKVLKRAISKDLIPLTNETWLTQPLTVTMMRHDFSLVQNRILIQIVYTLQRQIKQRLNPSPYTQLELFKEEELDPDDHSKIILKIEYKTISSDNNYYALEEALKMLSHIPVEIPVRGGSHRTTWEKSTNLCTVYIDKSFRKNKYAVLKMDREIAELLINEEFGYSKLGKEIVQKASNKFSQRIYMMMSSWTGRGKCLKKTIELRKALRLEDKYTNSFLDFEKRVLKPAATELKKSFDGGFCDLWFEYEPNYGPGQRRKDYPISIAFTVHTKKNSESIEEMSEQQKNSLQHMLETHLRMSPDLAASVVCKTNNFNNMVTKIMELYSYIKKHSSTIGNTQAYLLTSFKNFFAEENKIPRDDVFDEVDN